MVSKISISFKHKTPISATGSCLYGVRSLPVTPFTYCYGLVFSSMPNSVQSSYHVLVFLLP